MTTLGSHDFKIACGKSWGSRLPTVWNRSRGVVAHLFRIATLGFRGEALPSIASVSKMEIVSRVENEDVGSRLRVDGVKKGELQAAGCPVGSTVEVRDIFFNTPARRKFLKSPATELSHICDVINRMALAHAVVHFHLHHTEKMLGVGPLPHCHSGLSR